MKLNLNAEYLFLAAFIAVFLATGLGVYGQKLSHPYPVGYFASDAFFHQAETEWMKEQGTIKYALPNIEGGRKDVYDSHPPFVFEAVGTLSYASGLQVYDAIYLFVIIMLLLLGLLVYIIIRRFNKNVAVLSLPLTLLVYTQPFSQSIFFGQWLFIAGALFMMASFWAISRLGEKNSFILLAIFMAATALAHQPELLFAAMFLAIYLSAKWIKTRHALKEFVPVVLSGLTAFVLSAYSLNIFRLTWLMTYVEDAKLGLAKGTGVAEKGFSDVTLQSIGIGFQINVLTLIGLLIAAGLVLSLLLIFGKKKAEIWPAWIAFFILGISYLTFLGLAKRAFAHRWLWHFYFAFFFGLAAYYGLKAVVRKWNMTYSVAAAVVLLILFAMPSYGKTQGSLMDQNNWEAMKWAAGNLPENSSVYVFDLGRLQQSSALYNMRRTSYIIHRNSYQKAFELQGEIRGLEDIKISEAYEFGLASAYSHLLCDRGAFDYGYYHAYLPSADPECHDEFKEPTAPPRETKLCSMEYLYINTAENGNIALYNSAMAQKLLKKEWIRSVYSNPGITILKNSRSGDECL